VSKNFELLQEAGILLGSGSTPTAEGIDVEAKDQAPVIAKGLIEAGPAVREESMKLVQRLFLTPGQATPKAVMFAAIDSENGCSWLCALIAKLLAESVSGSVCLVEGNCRTPSLPKVLGVDNHYGLVDALKQEGAITGFAKPIGIGPNNFWLLSSGSLLPDSLSLLNGNRMKERVSELRREFDYLVIDAPPLNACADGIVLGRLADGVVLVLEANGTRREAALRVTESLRASNIPVLGAVLNNRTFPIPAALYKRL
jgi:Mrp family chromosome partitioning ATPase